MGFFEQMKQKKFNKANQAEMEQAEKNRASGNRVISALDRTQAAVVNLSDPGMKQQAFNAIHVFRESVHNSESIIHFDTVPVDDVLVDISDSCTEALKNLDMETVGRGLQYLKAGLSTCRKELVGEEATLKDTTIENRNQRMRIYRLLMHLSSDVFKSEKSVMEKTELLEKLRPELETKSANVNQYIAEHRLVWESLKNAVPGKTTMTPKMAELAGYISDAQRVNNQIQMTEAELSIQRIKYSSLLNQIQGLENALNQNTSLLTKEDIQEMQDLLNKSVTDMVNQMTTVKDLDNITKQQIVTWQQMMTDAGFTDLLSGYAIEWEERQQQIAREKDAEAALKRKAENEQKVTHAHESKKIILT